MLAQQLQLPLTTELPLTQRSLTRAMIPVVSLFCGCGGMDLGFREQDFIPLIAIDKDEAAIKTYNKNHGGDIAHPGDLTKLSGNDIIRLIEQVAPGVRPRGVIGGPPCQSFSLSNIHSKPDDPKHVLPLHYAKILKVLNKKYHLDFFVFENVVGLKSKKHQKRFSKILEALEDAGFIIFERVLNASWFGVPQSRRRVFVVGINKELYPNIKFEFPLGGQLPLLTVRNAIEGLPEPAYFSRSLKPYDIPYHPNHWTMNPRSSKLKSDVANNQASGKKTGRSFRRLNWDKPSWTVAYGNREIHIHPNGGRRLSVFEAMRLQGFPDSYELLGNFTQQITQVSDAVPPPLANAIAEAIQRTIYDREIEIQNRLLKWFDNNQRKFPWRETYDPYAVLIAEKLLQQTSANETVIAAYQKLLSCYPTINALAQARPEEIEPIITPLGFKYRAAELPRLAQEIVLRHAGHIPNDLDQLLHLPGVGDYIARAVLCFGYGQNVPIVDTNVARFLYRLFGLSRPLPSNPARKHSLIDQASNLVPNKNARKFNLAILDLCAKICIVSNPDCTNCPLREVCDYGTTSTNGKLQLQVEPHDK